MQLGYGGLVLLENWQLNRDYDQYFQRPPFDPFEKRGLTSIRGGLSRERLASQAHALGVCSSSRRPL